MGNFDSSLPFSFFFQAEAPKDVSVPTLKPHEDWCGTRIYQMFLPGEAKPRWLVGDRYFWTLRDARRQAQMIFFQSRRPIKVKRTKWMRLLDSVQKTCQSRVTGMGPH